KKEVRIMSKLKSLLLSSVGAVAVAAVAIGGTVAYLQDSDSDVNVMTLGEVKIEQIEQERNEAGELVEFSQAKPAYPAVGNIAWDEDGLEVNGTEYKVFDDGLKNVVDKIVTVNNTGKSDAYVRTLVAIEAPDGDPDNLIHLNYNGTDVTSSGNFMIEIDGVDYYVTAYTYKEALAGGKKSAPSLMQVFLDKKTTNEDCAKFGDAWEILVLSQAVQTNGFADAQTALNTAFGEVTDANAAVWFGGAKIPGVVESAIGMNKTTNQNGTFILANNIETAGNAAVTSDARYGYGYEYIIRKGVDYTLDLNGKTVSHKAINKNANHNALTYLFIANNAGTKLTINGEGKVYCHNSEGYTCAIQGKDGTLVTVNGGDYEVDNGIAVWAGAGAHIVINGGSFVNGNATTDHELIYSSGGVIDIYGGFFHNTDGNYTLNVEDRNRATGFINVYGGTYVNFDPSTGGQDPNNIKVADGYKVVSETQANGDVWYTVVAE
ncbi:MAG: hypothetical protein IJC01_02965, partial [Clostridia bacterium]|nr:hypothetical protein [Clostridia bacterium]